MKLKDNRTLDERALDLQKVLTWCIIHNVKKYYKTMANFKAAYSAIIAGKCTSEQQINFCSRFGFDKDTVIRKALGQIDGHWVKLADVKPFFDKWIHYQPHFNKNYRSGKTYSVHSYWYIDFDVVDRYLKTDDVLDCTSTFYSKVQYALINKIFLKNKGAKIMTKAQKDQYQKEYAEGKHALTLDDYIKTLRKEKRQADKHRMTIAKKAARQTLAEYAALQMKVQQLETQIKDKTAEMEARLAEKDEEIAKLKARLANTERQEPERREPEKKPSVQTPADDIDEKDATVIATTNGQKVIRCALEVYGARPEIRDYIARNKLVPVDDSMRFYYANVPGKGQFVIDAEDKNGKLLTLRKDMLGDFAFEVGSARIPRHFESAKLEEMQHRMSDKFWYSNLFAKYLEKHDRAKLKQAKDMLEDALGFKIAG